MATRNDFCRDCGGMMVRLVRYEIKPCERCKESNGWEPKAYQAEKKKADALQTQKSE